jgi:hypothetical protein
LAEPIAVLKIGIIMQRRIRATTLANRWAFKLDPIIRKTYSNEGLDQVENRNFAQNASADQLLPQLQMVVQELKTKFGVGIVLKDCQEILI